jgi:hypothetical protein
MNALIATIVVVKPSTVGNPTCDRVRDLLREGLEPRRQRREPLREDQIRVHVVDRDARQRDLVAGGEGADQLHDPLARARIFVVR